MVVVSAKKFNRGEVKVSIRVIILLENKVKFLKRVMVMRRIKYFEIRILNKVLPRWL